MIYISNNFNMARFINKYGDEDTLFNLLLKHLADDHMDYSKWCQYHQVLKIWSYSHPEDCESYINLRIKYKDEINKWKNQFKEFIKSF